MIHTDSMAEVLEESTDKMFYCFQLSGRLAPSSFHRIKSPTLHQVGDLITKAMILCIPFCCGPCALVAKAPPLRLNQNYEDIISKTFRNLSYSGIRSTTEQQQGRPTASGDYQ